MDSEFSEWQTVGLRAIKLELTGLTRLALAHDSLADPKKREIAAGLIRLLDASNEVE